MIQNDQYVFKYILIFNRYLWNVQNDSKILLTSLIANCWVVWSYLATDSGSTLQRPQLEPGHPFGGKWPLQPGGRSNPQPIAQEWSKSSRKPTQPQLTSFSILNCESYQASNITGYQRRPKVSLRCSLRPAFPAAHPSGPAVWPLSVAAAQHHGIGNYQTWRLVKYYRIVLTEIWNATEKYIDTYRSNVF